MMTSSFRGSSLIALSALFFGTYGIWSRLMGHTFGEFTQAWTRATLILIVLIPFALLTHQFKKIEQRDLKWFLIVALAGGFNQAPYYFGFQGLPIGTATLLFYVNLTLGAFLIGTLFFKEKLTSLHWLSLGIAVIGMGLVYTFTLGSDQLIPAILTSMAGLMGATTVVFSKKISHRYTEIQILSGTFLCMLITNLVFSFLVKEPLPPLEVSQAWLGQIGYCVAMVIANVSVVSGFKYVEPSIGGLIGLLEVFFGIVFGLLFFHEVLTLGGVIGTVMIVLAAGLPDLYAIGHKYLAQTLKRQ